MNPTNYQTDTFNIAINWVGDKGYFTGSYFSSVFSDGYDRLSWMNPSGTGSSSTGATTTTLAGGFQPNMLSTPPSNSFHQLNLTGGYALRQHTKLAGGFSYGRNTQNDAYLVDLMQVGGLPQNSLNALIVTTNANMKLTDQSVNDLSLSAGFKYNERLNRTGSNIYKMLDLGGGARLEINTPYSNKKAEYELAADYHLAKGQNLRVALDHDDIKKWCETVAGTGLAAPGSNCVIVPSSTEDKLVLSYKLRATSDINFNVAYSYAKRSSTVDHNATTPLNDNPSGTNNTTVFVNASNYVGYLAFFDASRNQDLLKASINWQAAERLSISLNGRYTKDKYPDSILGVQDGHSSSANLDATYSYSDNGTFSAYFSAQGRKRNMKSGASGLGATDNATNYAALVAPTNIWFNSLSDKDQTFGFNAKHKGLMSGKLELVGDMSLSVGKAGYHTDVPYYVPTANAPTCDNPTLLQCGDTPEIYSRILQLKLVGNYQMNKHSKIALGYMFQRQRTNDYYYNFYQYGYTASTALPTNQQAPNYSVNAVMATYIYTF